MNKPTIKYASLTVEQIDDFVDQNVRPISREFYKKEIRVDFELEGKGIIDPHAGNGIFWNLSLKQTI